MMRAGAEMGFSPAARMSLALTAPGDAARYIGSNRMHSSRLDQYLREKPDQLES
jgi:hypothetical protein